MAEAQRPTDAMQRDTTRPITTTVSGDYIDGVSATDDPTQDMAAPATRVPSLQRPQGLHMLSGVIASVITARDQPRYTACMPRYQKRIIFSHGLPCPVAVSRTC